MSRSDMCKELDNQLTIAFTRNDFSAFTALIQFGFLCELLSYRDFKFLSDVAFSCILYSDIVG